MVKETPTRQQKTGPAPHTQVTTKRRKPADKAASQQGHEALFGELRKSQNASVKRIVIRESGTATEDYDQPPRKGFSGEILNAEQRRRNLRTINALKEQRAWTAYNHDSFVVMRNRFMSANKPDVVVDFKKTESPQLKAGSDLKASEKLTELRTKQVPMSPEKAPASTSLFGQPPATEAKAPTVNGTASSTPPSTEQHKSLFGALPQAPLPAANSLFGGQTPQPSRQPDMPIMSKPSPTVQDTKAPISASTLFGPAFGASQPQTQPNTPQAPQLASVSLFGPKPEPQKQMTSLFGAPPDLKKPDEPSHAPTLTQPTNAAALASFSSGMAAEPKPEPPRPTLFGGPSTPSASNSLFGGFTANPQPAVSTPQPASSLNQGSTPMSTQSLFASQQTAPSTPATFATPSTTPQQSFGIEASTPSSKYPTTTNPLFGGSVQLGLQGPQQTASASLQQPAQIPYGQTSEAKACNITPQPGIAPIFGLGQQSSTGFPASSAAFQPPVSSGFGISQPAPNSAPLFGATSAPGAIVASSPVPSASLFSSAAPVPSSSGSAFANQSFGSMVPNPGPTQSNPLLSGIGSQQAPPSTGFPQVPAQSLFGGAATHILGSQPNPLIPQSSAPSLFNIPPQTTPKLPQTFSGFQTGH